MVFTIDDIKIEVVKDRESMVRLPNAVRLISEDNSLPFQNQTQEAIKDLVTNNYRIVKSYYESKANSSEYLADLSRLCLKIVLHYLLMYNLWRDMYKFEKNRDLTFLVDDFDSVGTHDIILRYFMKRYPQNYAIKCQFILNMTETEFKEFEKNRVQFLEMF
jgi:hypothetical protein